MHILLVDDHELFRCGLKVLLTTLDKQVTYTEASCFDEIQEIKDKDNFNLVLLDYHLPGIQGFECLHQVKTIFEAVPIVLLSGEDNTQVIRESIDHGAAGFIPKSSSQDVLIAALKLILAGGTYLPISVLDGINLPPKAKTEMTSSSRSSETMRILEKLTERQLEVLFLAIKGKPNKIIGRELNISESTVKTHLSVAFRTLGVQNRTEAVFMAAMWDMAKSSSSA